MSKLGNRKKAEEFMLKVVKDGDPSGKTLEEVKERLSKMDDKQFHEFIQRVKEGKEFIPLIHYNHPDGGRMTLEKTIELCEKYGIKLFQRYWFRHPVLGIKALSNTPVPFLHMMIRRQIETQENKRSVAEDNTRVDVLTGQPIEGASAITQPETLVYLEKGLVNPPLEHLKFRGGDIEGGRLFDEALIKTGAVSMEQLMDTTNTVPRSVQTLDIMLTGAHYATNLDPTKRG